MVDVEKLRELCNKATPGPWSWRGNSDCKVLYLMSDTGRRPLVMDFVRWGTQGAQPRFQQDELMIRASELMSPRAQHHSTFDLDVNHPDAEFIVAARNALQELLDEVERLRKYVGELVRGILEGRP